MPCRVAWPVQVPARLAGGMAARIEAARTAAGAYPPEWPAVAWLVKTIAGWRCERCGHLHGPVPWVLTDPVPELGRNEFDIDCDGVTEVPYRGTPADVSSRLCACGCGQPVEPVPTGRPRLYVGPAHRQRAYRRRLLDYTGELALGMPQDAGEPPGSDAPGSPEAVR